MKRRSRSNRRPLRAAYAAFFVAIGGTTSWVWADVAPRLGTGLTHSDNVDRIDQGSRSESVLNVDAGLVWQRSRQRSLADLDANVSRREYLDDVFEPETLGFARGLFEFALTPEHLMWVVEENYGQLATLPFGAIRPVDREDTNYFTTGPNVSVDLGNAWIFDALVRGSDVSYSVSDTDNRRVVTQARFEHAITTRRSLSFNMLSGRTKFELAELYPRYDLEQASVGFTSEGRRATVGVELGAVRVASGEDSDTQPLATFTIYRSISPMTLIGLDYSRGFTDAADAFRFDQTSGRNDLLDGNLRVAADPFERNQLALRLQSDRVRGGVQFSLYGERQRYQRSIQFDRDVYGFNIDGEYRFTPKVSGTLYSLAETNRELGSDSRVKDIQNGLALIWSATAALRAELHVERYSRKVDRGPFAEFTENRAFVQLTYAPPLPPRPASLFPARGVRPPVSEAAPRSPDRPAGGAPEVP